MDRLNEDKALSPDGFPIAFRSFSWDFVKDEVMGFFKECLEHQSFVPNATFFLLNPKKGNVEVIKNLGPISLLGSLYQI